MHWAELLVDTSCLIWPWTVIKLKGVYIIAENRSENRSGLCRMACLVWGSHFDEYEDDCHLEFRTMWPWRHWPVFWKSSVSPSPWWWEAVSSSEISVIFQTFLNVFSTGNIQFTYNKQKHVNAAEWTGFFWAIPATARVKLCCEALQAFDPCSHWRMLWW